MNACWTYNKFMQVHCCASSVYCAYLWTMIMLAIRFQVILDLPALTVRQVLPVQLVPQDVQIWLDFQDSCILSLIQFAQPDATKLDSLVAASSMWIGHGLWWRLFLYAGFTGDTGHTGPPGSGGTTGPRGPVGPIGFTGFTGSTGSVGAPGRDGFPGGRGESGATGATGESCQRSNEINAYGSSWIKK